MTAETRELLCWANCVRWTPKNHTPKSTTQTVRPPALVLFYRVTVIRLYSNTSVSVFRLNKTSSLAKGSPTILSPIIGTQGNQRQQQ